MEFTSETGEYHAVHVDICKQGRPAWRQWAVEL